MSVSFRQLGALVLLSAVTRALPAQRCCEDRRAGVWQSTSAAYDRPEPGDAGFAVSLAFVGSVPNEHWSPYAADGAGFSIVGLMPVARGSSLRVRADYSKLYFDTESLSREVTMNRVTHALTVGPELALARGAVRPYLGTSAGLAWLVTERSVDDQCGCYDPIGPALLGGHLTYQWSHRAGVMITLGRPRRQPVQFDLDLGVGMDGVGRGWIRDGGAVRQTMDPVVMTTARLGLMVSWR
jgi:hypothetical protein